MHKASLGKALAVISLGLVFTGPAVSHNEPGDVCEAYNKGTVIPTISDCIMIAEAQAISGEDATMVVANLKSCSERVLIY